MELGNFFPGLFILAECLRGPLGHGLFTDSASSQGERGTQIAVSRNGLDKAQEWSR